MNIYIFLYNKYTNLRITTFGRLKKKERILSNVERIINQKHVSLDRFSENAFTRPITIWIIHHEMCRPYKNGRTVSKMAKEPP